MSLLNFVSLICFIFLSFVMTYKSLDFTLITEVFCLSFCCSMVVLSCPTVSVQLSNCCRLWWYAPVVWNFASLSSDSLRSPATAYWLCYTGNLLDVSLLISATLEHLVYCSGCCLSQELVGVTSAVLWQSSSDLVTLSVSWRDSQPT